MLKNAAAKQAMQFVNNKISKLGLPDNAVKHRYQHALKGFAAKLTAEQLKKIKQDPEIKYIEQDRKFKVFTVGSFSKTIHARSTNHSPDRIIPWGVQRVGGPFVGYGDKAWIIGTGIDLDQPDLNVDSQNSISFVANETPNDVNGHGTFVAGILAAKDNSRGVAGVAAGATVIGVKVIDQQGIGTISNVVDGINYVDGKASSNNIINMSLGGPTSQAIDDAVISGANDGLRFVISAGNSKINAENVSPARVGGNSDNIYTVSAFKQGDEFAVNFDCGANCNAGSNYGNPPISYSEPGENITSLLIGGGIDEGYGGPGSEDGTSYAAPHLAGILLARPGEVETDGYVSSDPDGDPDPIGAIPPPPQLSVNFTSGPATVQPGELVAYTALATGGSSPYVYQFSWHYQNSGIQLEGESLNPNESNPYKFYVPNQTGTIILKVKATGSNDGTGFAIRRITVLGFGGPTSSYK